MPLLLQSALQMVLSYIIMPYVGATKLHFSPPPSPSPPLPLFFSSAESSALFHQCSQKHWWRGLRTRCVDLIEENNTHTRTRSRAVYWLTWLGSLRRSKQAFSLFPSLQKNYIFVLFKPSCHLFSAPIQFVHLMSFSSIQARAANQVLAFRHAAASCTSFGDTSRSGPNSVKMIQTSFVTRKLMLSAISFDEDVGKIKRIRWQRSSATNIIWPTLLGHWTNHFLMLNRQSRRAANPDSPRHRRVWPLTKFCQTAGVVANWVDLLTCIVSLSLCKCHRQIQNAEGDWTDTSHPFQLFTCKFPTNARAICEPLLAKSHIPKARIDIRRAETDMCFVAGF